MASQAFFIGLLICAQTPIVMGSEGTMQAAGLHSPTYTSSYVKVSHMRVPLPSADSGQVVIQVKSSSVNHLDLLWKVISPSMLWPAFVYAWRVQGGYPKVLGLDVAGTVTAVGTGVSRLKVGDEVWAFNAAACMRDKRFVGGIAGHTWAEYVAVDEDMVGLKPSGMSFSEAGALPLDALTALKALKDAGAPWKRNGTVLVLGASGGVGHFAVQLAKAFGAARVAATASESNRALVTSLGVDQFIDYHTSKWWHSSVIPDGSLIAVIDTVLQPKTGDRAFAKLRKHGSFVSLCGGIPSCGAPLAGYITELQYPTISQTSVRCMAGICAGAEQLDELRSLVDAGKLKVHIDQMFPLRSIRKAVAGLLGGHVVGKIGIAVNNESEPILF